MPKETNKLLSRVAVAAVTVSLVCSVFTKTQSAAAYQGSSSPHSGSAAVVVIQQPAAPLGVSVAALPKDADAAVPVTVCRQLVLKEANLLQQDVVFNLNQSSDCLRLSPQLVVRESDTKQIRVAARPVVSVTVKVTPGHYHAYSYAPAIPDENQTNAVPPVFVFYFSNTKTSAKVRAFKLAGAAVSEYAGFATLAELQVFRC